MVRGVQGHRGSASAAVPQMRARLSSSVESQSVQSENDPQSRGARSHKEPPATDGDVWRRRVRCGAGGV